MIKIAIADDHKLVRNGIKEILDSQQEMQLIASVDNGEDLFLLIKNGKVDVVLSDIDMPKLSGIEVVKKAKKEGLSAKIILISVHDEKAIIQEAFQIGADGYLLKRSDPELIIDAIHTVYKGKKFFDDDVMNIAMSPSFTETLNSDKEKLAKLTQRELEIIQLIVECHSNQVIADKLFLSKRTVDTHRNNLMVKMGFNNTVQLVKFALKNGLCEY